MEVIMSTLSRQELKEIFRETFQELNANKSEPKDEVDLIDAKEVASIFKVSKGTVNNWRKKGILNSYSIGRKRRYNKSEVYAALEQFKSNGGKLK
ncbi:helix-turn-helix domain-containing protein [Myroides odoratimimus]|uniref:helix-turn-helix domain-containing protein n=1 Tax=Myroides odoratimimus TaxID=76832 RepID=UPI0038D434BD